MTLQEAEADGAGPGEGRAERCRFAAHDMGAAALRSPRTGGAEALWRRGGRLSAGARRIDAMAAPMQTLVMRTAPWAILTLFGLLACGTLGGPSGADAPPPARALALQVAVGSQVERHTGSTARFDAAGWSCSGEVLPHGATLDCAFGTSGAKVQTGLHCESPMVPTLVGAGEATVTLSLICGAVGQACYDNRFQMLEASVACPPEPTP